MIYQLEIVYICMTLHEYSSDLSPTHLQTQDPVQ